MATLLNPGDWGYEYTKRKFLAGWVHPNKGPPSIHNILSLNGITSGGLEHWRYEAEVKARRGDANFQYQFHGTDRGCYLGESNNALHLCYRSDCSLCSIIRSSFDISHRTSVFVAVGLPITLFLARTGSNYRSQRFGQGVYTSSASSKADSYSDKNIPFRRYHAIILAKVIVGSTKELYREARHLTAPPWGYDSVTGMPSHGGLKYPETVVYRQEAIRPTDIIIYQRSNESDDSRDSEDSEDSED